TRLGVDRGARSQAQLPLLDESLAVIWMNRFHPAPALRLLSGHARVIEPYLIQEVAVAIGASRPRCCGNRIYDGTEVTLACSLCLLRLLSIFNIRACAVPPHDLARVIAESLSANEKPSVNTIMAAKARFDFVCFSGNQHFSPFFHQWWKVFRMESSLPAPTV